MRNVTWGLILVILGILLLLDNLGIADFGDIISEYWPLILIVWGLVILLRKRHSSIDSSSTTTQGITNELIHESSIFGDINLKINSKNFKGGSISTVFGDSFITLTDAVLAENEHHFNINGVFGDIMVTLPKDAAVSVSSSATFGDLFVLGQTKDGIFIDLHTTSLNYASSPNRLRLKIHVVFGDIKVIQ